MEERIQRKVEELHMNHPLFKPSLNPPTYQSLYQEAVRTLDEELIKEDLKKRIKQQQEERERIDKSWKEERERQERVKKEEEYEQFKLMQQKAEQEERERQRLHQEKVERELLTMDVFELEHKKEIITLILRWNIGKSLESYIQWDRKSPRHWYKIAPELREEAVKIRSEKVERRENPDSLLVLNDLYDIDCISEEHDADKCWDPHSESDLLHIALKELNVEIIKRIVRNKYPHKFA